MPRKPVFDHAVRKLRRIMGKKFTQEAFAREIGVSAIAIKRIENGSLKLSPIMKARIMWATGVDPDSLDSGEPRLIGVPYTPELYQGHREALRTREPGETKVKLSSWEIAERHAAQREMEALIDAAAYDNKFQVVLFLWHDWLNKVIGEFDLKASFLKAVASRRPKSIFGRGLPLSVRIARVARSMSLQRKRPSSKRKRRA